MAVKTSMTYDDGVAFRFDFPDGLSLSAVDVINGEPKLRFVPSMHVPSITEEDVAVCVRLSQEKTRPEFYYLPFPPGHPFYGRHYKDYRPSYLRGTSVGELLAEADWLMKCLNAGVRSDETKTKFKSWAENSQLDGLATSEYFSATASQGSIFMMCKSVEVDKSEEEMWFSDPKMAINSMRSSSYSNYLTEKFDAIAYYDEPLFSKMKELIKLILAVEWFEEKGVKFSMEWVNENLSRSQMSARQVIAVKRPELTQKIVDYVLKQFFGDDTAPLLAVPTVEIPAIQMPSPCSVMIPAIQITTSKTMTEKTFQIKHVRNIDARPAISIEFTLTISVDDFDLLYQEENPNTSIYYRDENGKLAITVPNVESWSKLFAETVPIPCKGVITSNGEMVDIVYGGVTTRDIPVKNVTTVKARATQKQEVRACASPSRKKQRSKRSEMPTQKLVRRPSSDATCDNQQRFLASSKSGDKPTFGIKDRQAHTRSRRDGKIVEQQQTVTISASQTLSVRGQYNTRVTACQECLVPSELEDETEEMDEDDADTDVEEEQQEDVSNQMNVPRDQDSNAEIEVRQPQRENLTLPLEQLAADAKGSPTGSDNDSGMHDDMSDMLSQSASDLLSPTSTIDSGLG